MCSAIVAQIIYYAGSVLCNRLASLFLAVEYSQRILVKSLSARRTHIVKTRAEITLERGIVLLATFGTADRIDIEYEIAYSEFIENSLGQHHYLYVRRGRKRAVILYAELVMLSESARLRFFITENRRYIIHFRRLSVAVERVFDKSSRYSRRTFGLQGNTSSALVLEGIHFLVDYIRGIAHASQKQFGVFKRRRADFVDAKSARDFSHGFFYVMPLVTLFGQNVLCTFRYVYHLYSLYHKIYLLRFIFFITLSKCLSTNFLSITTSTASLELPASKEICSSRLSIIV